MSLRVGDKVKMTKRGFQFYANVDTIFEMHSFGEVLNSEHFTSAVCSLFAVHGVGTVQYLSEYGDPNIRWELSINGMRYYYSHYFDERDVQKLTLLDKLCFKLRKFLC